jgi:hypothetical protein
LAKSTSLPKKKRSFYVATEDEATEVWIKWHQIQTEEDENVWKGEQSYLSAKAQYDNQIARKESLRPLSSPTQLPTLNQPPDKSKYVQKRKTMETIDQEVVVWVQRKNPRWGPSIGKASVNKIRSLHSLEEVKEAYKTKKFGRPTLFNKEVEDCVIAEITQMQLRNEAPFEEDIESMICSFFC